MGYSRIRNDSQAGIWVEQFRRLGPEVAPRVIVAAWDQLPLLERVALAEDWSFWARSKQIPPSNSWITWGFLTGRGFGKTVSIAKHINDEVRAGRASLVGLAAQDEASAVDIQVNGPSGLIATANPRFRPHFEASALQLVWPNGARAYVRTPEVPGKIRGLEYHLSWTSELQSWPNGTREEAFSNFLLATRLGYARLLWDSTPKRRHPLLKELLSKHAADPEHHHIVRGTLYENADNLGESYTAEMRRKYGGTQKGREELLGEMLEDSDLALVRQEWIDDARRPAPSTFVRRVVSVDPATTARKGSDETGIVEVGLGSDGRAYVLGNDSGKHKPAEWAAIVLDRYVKNECDAVIVETNKAGELVTENLRAAAKERGLEVLVVERGRKPVRIAGKVFVKEVYARGAKDERAEPVATAYERRRVSHVAGVDLGSLEDTLTTWEPAPNARSPGDLDALVHAVVELLDLANGAPDAKIGFQGINEVAKKILAPTPTTSLAQVFSTVLAGRADRI